MTDVVNTLFHVVSIAVVLEIISENKSKGKRQEHKANDLTRPGQRPGVFSVFALTPCLR